MSVIRWDPFTNVNTLQDRINRMFEETFPQAPGEEALRLCTWKPLVDIYETASGIVIAADLPGVDKTDVSVEIKNDVLTLKGERRCDPHDSEERYYRRERCCGTFHRAFTLKSTVAPDKIKAKFKNGVLVIELPWPETEALRQITVDVA